MTLISENACKNYFDSAKNVKRLQQPKIILVRYKDT